jgi:hypothetical protein
MCSGRSDWTLLQPGFPIRKSSNQSSIGSSSRLIAALYVLHRLLMPRHPPCALINLALAEIIFITRCSRPLCSSQITGRNQNRLELFVHRVNSGQQFCQDFGPTTDSNQRIFNLNDLKCRSEAHFRAFRTQQRA